MVEATQTSTTFNPALDTTGTTTAHSQQQSGMRGKLAQLKNKLGGGTTSTADPYGTHQSGFVQQPQTTGFVQPQTTGFVQQPQTTGFVQQPQTTGFVQQPQQLQQPPLLSQGLPTNETLLTENKQKTFAQPSTTFVQPQQTTGFASNRSSISSPGSDHHHLRQQQQPVMVENTSFTRRQSTEIIQERPVLDRVEKIIQKEVIQKPTIQEQIRQDVIEVHERPIEKRFMHPMQEVRVQSETQYEIQGKEAAEFERTNLISQLREKDRLHQVTVDQRQDVRMSQEPTQMSQTRETRKEVIYKPIVTEIHEQPIREIHEQSIQRTIYEKPIITVIRDQAIIENITSAQPLSGINYQATPVQHYTPPPTKVVQPVVQKVFVQPAPVPVAQSVIVEKSATESLPHVVGTGLNASEVDAYESKSLTRK